MYQPQTQDIWLDGVERLPSPNFGHRDCQGAPVTQFVDVLVIHNISLPPAQCEEDFNQEHVEAFFCNQLDVNAHPVFKELSEITVSAHLYIRRDGSVVQFVPLNKMAWHAGVSQFKGRDRCNEFSIGIELQGTDFIPYQPAQYESLIEVTHKIRSLFPAIAIESIVGHVHIAPERKTDPGPSFDWERFKFGLCEK